MPTDEPVIQDEGPNGVLIKGSTFLQISGCNNGRQEANSVISLRTDISSVNLWKRADSRRDTIQNLGFFQKDEQEEYVRLPEGGANRQTDRWWTVLEVDEGELPAIVGPE